MKLIDRLKGENKAKLAYENLNYPHLVALITDALEKYERVSDLPYGVWQDAKMLMPYLTSPYDLFYE